MSWKKIQGYETTYLIVKEGKGRAVKKNDRVTVHATGTVNKTGKTFWSTKTDNSPFTYEAGKGKVIIGWEMGVLGMKLGEIRKINIPAKEGYGINGFPEWGIPKNGAISYEIEILKIS